ncbi:hypothetical protein J2R80_007138 [Bradyrhizobium sp. USDA 4541]|nr:hypothetical protein [Bradyrhizobium sp. USDA 4541]
MTLKLDLRPHASRIATHHARRPPSDAYNLAVRVSVVSKLCCRCSRPSYNSECWPKTVTRALSERGVGLSSGKKRDGHDLYAS